MTHDQLASDAVELLPCPFCGGEAELRPVFFGGAQNFAVLCLAQGCLTKGPVNAFNRQAAEYWNTRTPPPSTVHNDVEYGKTQSTVHKQSCDYPTVHNDAVERRVEAIARCLCAFGCEKPESAKSRKHIEGSWRMYTSDAHEIIAADPLTAEHERVVAGKAHWEQREADNWAKLQKLTAAHAETASLLAEAGRVLGYCADILACGSAQPFSDMYAAEIKARALLSRIEGAAK